MRLVPRNIFPFYIMSIFLGFGIASQQTCSAVVARVMPGRGKMNTLGQISVPGGCTQ